MGAGSPKAYPTYLQDFYRISFQGKTHLPTGLIQDKLPRQNPMLTQLEFSDN
jgi:hypothetical protein